MLEKDIMVEIHSLMIVKNLLLLELKNYLGVTSQISDYGVGQDLYAEPIDQAWLLVAKYSGYAVVTSDTILEVGATGQYEYYDETNRVIKDESPNFDYLQQALEQISRFRK